MGQDLIAELYEQLNLLDGAIKQIRPRGTLKAKSEHEYRVALSKFITEERANGTPVTILHDIARGNEAIASLRLRRDLADSLYNSNLEAINVLKLKIRILEAQIAREWGGTSHE